MPKRKERVCKHCGWKWTPRVSQPKQCPRCKRYDWNKKPVKK